MFSDGCPLGFCDACAASIPAHSDQVFVFKSPMDQVLAQLMDTSPASIRFLERIGKAPQSQALMDLMNLIVAFVYFLPTSEEVLFNKQNVKSRRQALEESVYGRLAYHCFREYGDNSSFRVAIEEQRGDFLLLCGVNEHPPFLKRWWNAAREDQATDRVYRIGQKRAVQVFKLIAEGTLEEKTSAIINRKRSLMNSVIEADDPHLSKIFSSAELIDLLRPV